MPRSKRKKIAEAKEAEAERALVDHPAWGLWRPGYRADGSLIRQRRSTSGHLWNFKADPRNDGNR